MLLHEPHHLELGHLHGTLGHLWTIVQPILFSNHAILEEAFITTKGVPIHQVISLDFE
jgi:hypothetical protein